MGLVLGGFLPFTTIDYPGKLAATVFVQGCPWRCPYCHNAALQTLDRQPDAADMVALRAQVEPSVTRLFARAGTP